MDRMRSYIIEQWNFQLGGFRGSGCIISPLSILVLSMLPHKYSLFFLPALDFGVLQSESVLCSIIPELAFDLSWVPTFRYVMQYRQGVYTDILRSTAIFNWIHYLYCKNLTGVLAWGIWDPVQTKSYMVHHPRLPPLQKRTPTSPIAKVLIPSNLLASGRADNCT